MTILNMRNFRDWNAVLAQYPTALYVGRPHKKVKNGALTSPLANQFHSGNRMKDIADYRAWLFGEIKANNREVVQALWELEYSPVLVCWCAPLPCHSEVIIKAIKALREANDDFGNIFEDYEDDSEGFATFKEYIQHNAPTLMWAFEACGSH